MCRTNTEWEKVEEDMRRFYEDSFVLDSKGVGRDLTGEVVTRNVHGYLGKGCRVKIPDCVVTGIRDMCPDEDGSYMGFKEK